MGQIDITSSRNLAVSDAFMSESIDKVTFSPAKIRLPSGFVDSRGGAQQLVVTGG